MCIPTDEDAEMRTEYERWLIFSSHYDEAIRKNRQKYGLLAL